MARALSNTVSRALLALALGTAPAFAGEGLRLRPQVTVAGDTIRLSDLVEGLEADRDVALFKAPAPGQRGTIQAVRVLSAARDYGFTGIATGGAEMVAIARIGITVTREQMIGAVRQSLGKIPEGDAIDITLAPEIGPKTIDPDRAAALTVADFRRASDGTFTGRIVTAGDRQGLPEAWPISGTISTEREIAVATIDLTRGEPITERDIALARRPIQQITPGMFADATSLIGLIPRRTIRTGEMLRETDLVRPMMVERGQVVTVLHKIKGMVLTMRGKALASGAEGAAVRIQNTQSKKIVEGVVSGLGQVTVTSASLEAAADAAASRKLAEAR